jgi:hypothetical protein
LLQKTERLEPKDSQTNWLDARWASFLIKELEQTDGQKGFRGTNSSIAGYATGACSARRQFSGCSHQQTLRSRLKNSSV